MHFNWTRMKFTLQLYIYTYVNTECNGNPFNIFSDETCILDGQTLPIMRPLHAFYEANSQ